MKGFMFYDHFVDLIEGLSDLEKGEFLTCLVNYYKTYQTTKQMPAEETKLVVKLSFKAVKNDVDRYLKICEGRAVREGKNVKKTKIIKETIALTKDDAYKEILRELNCYNDSQSSDLKSNNTPFNETFSVK